MPPAHRQPRPRGKPPTPRLPPLTQLPTASPLHATLSTLARRALSTLAQLRAAISTHQSPSKSTPRTPLCAAAASLDAPAVHALLAAGADPRAGTPGAWHFALRAYSASPWRGAAVVKALTQADLLDGACEAFAEGGFPPRVAALMDGCEGALRVMLRVARRRARFAELREMIEEDGLPKVCCERGRLSALRVLLEEGWDACLPDRYGATLVHHVCNAPYLVDEEIRDVVKLFIEHGNADLSLRDSFGRTVLQIARKRRLSSVCALLREYGADEESYTTLLLRGVSLSAQAHGEKPQREWWRKAANAADVFPPFLDEARVAEDPFCCVICQDCIEPTAAVQASCNHIFHIDCLNNWVKESSRCPSCTESLGEPFDN